MKKLLFTALSLIMFTNVSTANETNFQPTPLQTVLADNNFITDTELSNISLNQSLPQGEQSDNAMITLIQSSLMDDSIFAIKTVYFLKLHEQGWAIDGKFQSHKCRRGENTDSFTEARCP